MQSGNWMPSDQRLRVYRATWRSTGALESAREADTAMRGHRAGEPVPIYASLEFETAVREVERVFGMRLDGALLRCTTLDFVGAVFDARDEHALTAAGITIDELRAENDRSSVYRLIDYACGLGAQAVVVPSIAVADRWNLFVLRDALDTLTVVDVEIYAVPTRAFQRFRRFRQRASRWIGEVEQLLEDLTRGTLAARNLVRAAVGLLAVMLVASTLLVAALVQARHVF